MYNLNYLCKLPLRITSKYLAPGELNYLALSHGDMLNYLSCQQVNYVRRLNIFEEFPVITSFNKLQQDSQKIHRHASHQRETFLTTRSIKLLYDMHRRPNMTSHDIT